jgi:hypothetical protein
LRVELLYVPAAGTARDAGDHCARGTVEGIVLVGKPPRVIDGTLRNPGYRRAVYTKEAAAAETAAVVLLILDGHNRRAEPVNLELLTAYGHPNPVEGAGRVEPANMPDQALLTKNQLLSTDTREEWTPLRVANFGIRHPEIEYVSERGAYRPYGFLGHPRVLRLDLKRQELHWLNAQIDPEAIQPIQVVTTAREPGAGWSLHAITELPANADPVWQHVVQSVWQRRARRGRRLRHLTRGARGTGLLRLCLTWRRGRREANGQHE